MKATIVLHEVHWTWACCPVHLVLYSPLHSVSLFHCTGVWFPKAAFLSSAVVWLCKTGCHQCCSCLCGHTDSPISVWPLLVFQCHIYFLERIHQVWDRQYQELNVWLELLVFLWNKWISCEIYLKLCNSLGIEFDYKKDFNNTFL